MSKRCLDFRSDTVTRPTPGMRRAMADAAVGDDVFREDPTVQLLEKRVASLLGKEAALFVPSGTMSNLIGVRLHCRAGDEMICEAGCHILNYEQAGYAQLSGVAARAVQGEHGVLRLEQLAELIRPDNPHQPRTRLLTLENTHNRGGGRILPYDGIAELCDWAHASALRTHLDGARLMNAVVATGVEASQWASHFDTVSICFSKGLGAPVGSALAGPAHLIDEALRHRKVLGGGMRQAGILAAAAIYALDNHVERLSCDHAHARMLAGGIAGIDGLALDPPQIDTNMLFFAVDPALGSAADFSARLAQMGLLVLPTSRTKIRAVTHLDIDEPEVRLAIDILRTAAGTRF